MRVLWSIHLYPPLHNCGAEYVAHNVNRYLIAQGHEVKVLLHQGGKTAYNYEGVSVVGVNDFQDTNAGLDFYAWGDILLTHLDFSQHTVHMGRMLQRPVMHFVHNSYPYQSITEAVRKQYVVYNSKWVKNELNYQHDSIVLYPPCPMDKYKIAQRQKKFVTMINVNENKGGFLLYRLAKEMPEEQFLAIKGSYDDGGLQPEILNLLATCENVTIKDHCDDVNWIYSNTKALLVLSRYESWGRVATEAMINGIPVIACPTAGLKENCELAALWVPERGAIVVDKQTGVVTNHDGYTYNIQPIKWHIEKLRKDSYYNAKSFEAGRRAHALEIERINQMYELEKFIHYAKQDYQGNRNTKKQYTY